LKFSIKYCQTDSCVAEKIFPFIQRCIGNDGPVHIFGRQLVDHRLLPLRRAGKVVGEIPYSTGDAIAGPATVQVYDPNGVLVATLCAEAVGTRFEL